MSDVQQAAPENGHGDGHGHAHGAGHSHVPSVIRFERPLWIAFGLTLCFMLVEVAGGLWANSLALLSDAAHMMTDVIALGVSLFAVRMARKPADAKRTYGYARMEAIGALVNGGRSFLLTNPIYSLAPGIAIALLVICLNTLGDGVRDALDPRLRGEV